MKEKDLLIDDILNDISGKRTRAGGMPIGVDSLVDEILAESSYRKTASVQERSDSEVNPVVTSWSKNEEKTEPRAERQNEEKPVSKEAAAEDAVSVPVPVAAVPIVEEQPSPQKEKKEKPVKEKKEKKRKKKQEEEDLLATITPWDQRHARTEVILPDQANRSADSIDNMTGVKKSRSFLQSLKQKNTASAETPREDVLYKKGDTVILPQPVIPAPESGNLADVSTMELKETVAVAAKEIEETYEPTRMVTRVVPSSETFSERSKSLGIHPDEITGQVRLEGFDTQPINTPTEEKWENEFVSGREDKIKQFKMNKPEQDDTQPLTHEEDGEYHTPQDATPIKYDLLARRHSVGLRFWVTFVLFVVSVLLTVSHSVDLTNGLLSDNPSLLIGIYLFVLIVVALLNIGVVLGGLKTLFSGSDQDTPAALAMIVSLVQGGVMAAVIDQLPANFSAMFMGSCGILAILLNLWGKRLVFNRLYRNVELIGNDRIKHGVTLINNKEEAFELGRGLSVGTPIVAMDVKERNLQDFIYHSYAPDGAERAARLPTCLFLLFGAVGGVAGYLFTVHATVAHMVVMVVSGFAGGVCVGLPLCLLLSGNLPFARVTRRLFRRRIMLSGYDAVEEFRDTDVLTIDASQLFPSGTVTLKSIKSASNQSLDRSIMDVAGVVYTADCPLKSLFESIIQGKTDLLPEVDSLVYEEEMGLSGWVSGYRVLVGTRQLMENHGVAIPEDVDYEEKYNESGLKAVYLSTQGILSAVFLVKYTADPRIAQAVRHAVDSGLSLHVYSCDPNLTRDMICRMFRLPTAAVRIMGPVARRLYKQQAESQNGVSAILSYEKDAGDFCSGITAAKHLGKVIRVAAVLQILCLIAGVALFAFGIYTQGTAGMSGSMVLVYQLATTLITLGLPFLMGR